jgi:hypothetical protein
MDNSTINGIFPEPDYRGTFGLIWTCFATVLLCTWNVAHPNLPAEDDGFWSILCNRLGYFLLGLVAPEWITCVALIELFEALAVKRKVCVHLYRTLALKLTTVKSPKWSLTLSFYLVMGGLVIEDKDNEDEHAIIRLKPKRFLRLIDQGIMDWPKIPDSEIMDHSKSDWFLKMLALIQIGYFVAQTIGRHLEHLPITPVETYTLGTIVCAITTYIAWWSKPFDIRKPTICYPELLLPSHLQSQSRFSLTQIQTKAVWPIIITGYVSVAFGYMHFIGASYPFPTRQEKLLWEHSTKTCMAVPWIICMVLVSLDHYQKRWKRPKLADTVIILLGILYGLSRLSMMVEMFVCMRSAPISVYKTPQWSQYIPSFG